MVNGSGVLPPPPPPVLPSPTAPINLKFRYLPPECRPKVDALSHLILHIDDSFDRKAQLQMRLSEVGEELAKVFSQCENSRLRTMICKRRLEQSSAKQDRQSYEQNLVGMQECLLNTACPERMRQFMTCWTTVDPSAVKHMKDHGLVRYICQSERQALERCGGQLVARSVRAADEDPFDDDTV